MKTPINTCGAVCRASLVAISVALLSACGSDDDPVLQTPPAPPAPVPTSYTVSVTNITNGQPVSPVAVMLHDAAMLWQVGMPASDAVERMAESGDVSQLVANSAILASSTGMGVIPPGENEMISVTINDRTDNYLSIATMLVNTNDAFTGLANYDLSELSVGDSIHLRLPVWDAGTEANSETALTIPGPAGNGEGFNMARETRNTVAYHAGVVTADDGLNGSALSVMHRFDQSVLAVSITRTE
jgi:hypothetical protein